MQKIAQSVIPSRCSLIEQSKKLMMFIVLQMHKCKNCSKRNSIKVLPGDRTGDPLLSLLTNLCNMQWFDTGGAKVLFYGTRNCTLKTIQNVIILTVSCTNTQKTFCISSRDTECFLRFSTQNSSAMKKKLKPGRGFILYLIEFAFNFLDSLRILNILSKMFLVLDNPL